MLALLAFDRVGRSAILRKQQPAGVRPELGTGLPSIPQDEWLVRAVMTARLRGTVTEVRKPPRLASGDRVAVVSPAGPLTSESIELGTSYLRDWGLKVELMPSAMARHDRLPYLAGADAARALDFRDAWLDPQYAAVFAARGGSGAQRMLQHLDMDELAGTEKILVGFSDITALHEAFNARGLVTGAQSDGDKRGAPQDERVARPPSRSALRS